MNYLIYLLPDAVVLAVALSFWSRSRHPGFAWFAAAFAIKLAHSLLLLFPYSLGGPSRYRFGIFLLFQVSLVMSYVMMVIGLRRFFATVTPKPESVIGKTVAPVDLATVKRQAVGIIGVGLILAGVATVIRGINFITAYNGELADLGAGPGAILVGLMCVGLAVHPRSPFRKRVDQESSDE